MPIEFHRLTTPTYHDDTIGTLGTHDYINDGLANGIPGAVPALADGAKGGTPPNSPNAGSYFVAFGEDLVSSNLNRPALALAQNTDYLDDAVHRDLAVPVVKQVSVTPGAHEFTLPGDIFVGMPGTADTPGSAGSLVSLYTPYYVENWYIPLISPTGPGGKLITVHVTGLRNSPSGSSVIGDPIAAGGDEDGFFTDPTIYCATAFPLDTVWALCYERANVVNQTVDQNTKLANAEMGLHDWYAAVYNAGRCAHASGLPDWKDGTTNPSPVLVENQIRKMILDLVNVAGSNRINSQDYAGTQLSLSDDVSIFAQSVEIVDFINDMLDSRANTWGGSQTFNDDIAPRKSIIDVGQDLRGSVSDAVTARYKLQGAPFATSWYTLLEEYEQDVGDSLCKRRRYLMANDAGGLPGILTTYNFRWSQGDLGFYYDDNTKSAEIHFDKEWYYISPGVTEPVSIFAAIGYQSVVVGLNSAWYEPPTTQWITGYRVGITNGFLAFGALSGDERILNPHHTQPNVDNRLYGKNVCKAWAKIGIQYDDPDFSPYVADGFNVASVEYGGGDSRYLRINWVEPFEDTNYIIVPSFYYTPSLLGVLNIDYTALAVSVTTTYCVLRANIVSAAEGLPTLVACYALDFDDFCDPTPPPDWEGFIYIVAYGAQP